MLLELILVGLGIALLMKGADFLVDGSSRIAKKFNIPEIVIGLTIVAIGTSLPELVISIDSAMKGLSDISMGNVVGSNFANLFFIISLCAVIKPITIKRETKLIENPLTILCTALLYFISMNDGVISRYEGIALLVMTLLYILYNVVMSKVGNKFDEEDEKTIKRQKKKQQKNSKFTKKSILVKLQENHPLIYSIVQILLGIICLKFGGDLVVDNAILIAETLGLSEKLISLTIVAFGTSLPELITCVSATKKGETDLAVGNIIGSQVFNILLIIGSAAAITPIQGVRGYKDEMMILLIGTIIFAMLPFIGQKNKVGRTSGIAFVSFYLIYMCSLVYENLQL